MYGVVAPKPAETCKRQDGADWPCGKTALHSLRMFLGGRPKGPFLEAFGADIFFDDSEQNIASARDHVAAGHVPHGVANLRKVD